MESYTLENNQNMREIFLRFKSIDRAPCKIKPNKFNEIGLTLYIV